MDKVEVLKDSFPSVFTTETIFQESQVPEIRGKLLWRSCCDRTITTDPAKESVPFLIIALL